MKSRLTLHRNYILDAVRRRFHVRPGENRFDLLMERDHFSAELPIEVDHDLNRIRFCVEDASGVDHSTRVTLGGLRGGATACCAKGRKWPSAALRTARKASCGCLFARETRRQESR